MHQARLDAILAHAERHARAGRLGRAITFYRKVLGTSPPADHRHTLAQGRLGDLHLAMGQPAIALSHLERAQARCPHPDYALMIGRALLELDRPAEAAVILHEALRGRHRREALRALTLAALAQGDRGSARALATLAEEGELLRAAADA